MLEPKESNMMLTTGEVARLLRVHINTLRRWTNQGLIKAYRIGNRGDRRFRQQDISSFLAQRNQDYPPEDKI